LKRDHVVPENIGYYEYLRSMEELIKRDRGGSIFSPKVGLVHENVAELDFESEYPNLIIKDGLSYETVTSRGVVPNEDALLPFVTQQILERRLYFKKLRREFQEESDEWFWCEHRQLALKNILVCLYGTSGCCWNRFGNVLCFEEINKRSRETLFKTKKIVQNLGFEIIYADTDSCFVKKKGSTKEDYNELSLSISDKLGIPIALDHHYRYLTLLPIESDPTGNMEAQKRYFGILTNDEILARGIEIRRHDTPPFVKKFQRNLIRILFEVEEVYTKGYRKALNYVIEVLDEIMKCSVSVEELIVSKILRKPLSDYSSKFPHVAAAIQLSQCGQEIRRGENIQFVYINADHSNPLRRVVPYAVYDGDDYDRIKYRDLILDAAETVLRTFGFTRQQFGTRLKKSSFTWEIKMCFIDEE
jgi:DNA polymerase elongation subunit (family B)